MQPLDVLSSYVRRRGYLDKTYDSDRQIDENSSENSFFSPNFVSKIDRFRFNNSLGIVEELEKYIKFLNLLSFDDRQSLLSINRRIIGWIDRKNCEIPQRIFSDFNKIALDDNFSKVSQVDLNLIRKIINFINNAEIYFLADLIKNSIDFNDQSIKSEKDESDFEAYFDDFQQVSGEISCKSVEISPEWLKINELKVEILSRNEQKSNELSDVLFYYRLSNPKSHILSIDLSADRRYFACGTENGAIILKYLKSSEENRRNSHLNLENSSIFCLKILNKSQDYFLCGSENGSIRIVRSTDGKTAGHYYGHRYPVFSLDIEPEDQFFVTASFDQTARLFNFYDNQAFRILAGHSDAVQCAAFVRCTTGRRPLVATASADRAVRLWTQDQALPIRIFNGCTAFPTVLSSCSAKNIMACASAAEGKINFYDLRNDKCVQILDTQDFLPYSMDFDDQGRVLVSGSNGRLKIFEWDSVLCKFNESSRAFAVPGDGIVYCFKIPNYDYPYLSCVSADLCV